MMIAGISKVRLLAATALMCAPTYAMAGQAAATAAVESGVQDIVITARRTAETSQTVPIAISTVTAESLQRNLIQNATDLTREVASLRITESTTAVAGLTISMRGQTQTGTAANDTSSVGIYINDLFLSSAPITGSVLNLQDLERVEVLKGAQGTLYGRNVTAGVVKFVTKRPSDEFEASITGGLGNYDRRFLSGVINIPLGETMAFRAVGSLDNRGGFSRDAILGLESDDQDRWNLRGAISWQPTDNFQVLLEGGYGEYSQSDSDMRTTYIQPGVNAATMNVMAQQGINGLTPAALSPIIFFGGAVANGTATPAQQAAFFQAFGAATAALPQVYATVDRQYNATRRNSLSLNSQLRTPAESTAYNGALTLTLDLGAATIKSITGYDRGDTDRFFNVGGGPWIPLYTNQNGYSEHWTQEVQLTGSIGDRFNYTAGVFYMDRDSSDNREDSSQFGAFPFFLGQFGLRITNGATQVNTTNTKSYAGYGQATYEVVDNLRITGGLRYTKEDVSVTSSGIQKPQAASGFRTVCVGPAPTTQATPIDQCFGSADASFSAWSYTAGVDYTPIEDVLLYAKTSRGFKSGGLNVFTGAGAPIQEYEPEITQDYELGLKSRFFDRKVLFNLTAFRTDYQNIQRAVSFEASPGLILTATRNAASAQIDGVEAELKFAPLPGLEFGGSLAYTDGQYKDYSTVVVFPPPTGPVVQDLSDVEFQGLAPWVYNLSLGYSTDLPGIGSAHAQVNWSHRSSANLFENDSYPTASGPATPLEETRQGAYGLLDASISFDIDRFDATLMFWGKNIMDTRYRLGMISLSNNGVGYAWANFGAPATFGVDLTFRF